MSLAWTAMVEFTWKIFPKEITTSGLGVIGSMMWIAPSLFANSVGATLYHLHGGPWVFRGMAIIGGVWLVVMIIYFEFCGGKEQPVEPVQFSNISEKWNHNDDQKQSCEEIGYNHDVDLHGVE